MNIETLAAQVTEVAFEVGYAQTFGVPPRVDRRDGASGSRSLSSGR